MILDGNSKVGEAKVYATQKEMVLTKEVEGLKEIIETLKGLYVYGDLEWYEQRRVSGDKTYATKKNSDITVITDCGYSLHLAGKRARMIRKKVEGMEKCMIKN